MREGYRLLDMRMRVKRHRAPERVKTW
jgi:hypothetical protein